MPEIPRRTTSGDGIQLSIDSKTMKEIERLKASLKETQKRLDAQVKTSSTIAKQVAEWRKHSEGVQKSVKHISSPLNNNVRALQRQTREIRRSDSAFKSLVRTAGGFAAILSAGGVIAAGFNQLRKIVDSRLNAGVLGGPGQIKEIRNLIQGRDVGLRNALDLFGGAGRQSSALRFGALRSPVGLKGLVSLQEQLNGVGGRRATGLIEDVLKKLPPSEAQSFLTNASTDPRRALEQAANIGNINQITDAINALELSRAAEMDPVLRAALNVESAQEKLARLFEQFVDFMANKFLPAAQKIAASVQAFVGNFTPTKLPRVGTPRLAPPQTQPTHQSSGGGAGQFLQDAYISEEGVASAGFGASSTFHGARAYASRANGISSLLFKRAVPRLLPWVGLATDAYTIGRGATEGVGLVGDLLFKRQVEADFNLRKQESISRAKKNLESTDEVTRLKAERDIVRGQIANGPGQANFQALRDRYHRLSLEINSMLNPPETKAVPPEEVARHIEDAATATKDWVSTGLTTFVQKAKEAQNVEKERMETVSRLAKIQEEAVRFEQLQDSVRLSSLARDLARVNYALASAGPFGSLVAQSELNQLLRANQDQIGLLEEQLKALDASTFEGKIQSLDLQKEIQQLRLDSRQAQKQFMEAFLDSQISLGLRTGGAFEKIVIDTNKNLAKGLELGILRQDVPAITGSLTPSGRLPRDLSKELANHFGYRVPEVRRAARNQNPAKNGMDAAQKLKEGAKLILEAAPGLSSGFQDQYESDGENIPAGKKGSFI